MLVSPVELVGFIFEKSSPDVLDEFEQGEQEILKTVYPKLRSLKKK